MTTSHTATIRTARLDDYAAACRLMDGVDELHRERLPWMFKAPAVQARSETFFGDLLNRLDSAVFVADAGAVVGIAVGLMRSAPDHPIFVQQRYGVIEDIVVEPGWRRRGVGRLLAHSIETWATGLGAPWIELNVYEFNAKARRFYEALGYLPLSTKLRKPTGPDAA
jgi:diamine N-acetyltransferase